MARRFEFHAYRGGEHGEIAERADIMTHTYEEKAQAVAYAGRLAKRINGPVDVALEGSEPWADRYITTANPSPYHAAGYRTERLT
jgi:glucose-6-phosphate dehydrogenase assembly protein OpcA